MQYSGKSDADCDVNRGNSYCHRDCHSNRDCHCDSDGHLNSNDNCYSDLDGNFDTDLYGISYSH